MRAPYPATNAPDTAKQGVSPSTLVLVAFVLFTFLLHLVLNLFFAYGYFRDEFYYLACGEHLDWGYVDHPPLIAVIANVSRLLFGDGVAGIRMLAAVAAAGVVGVTGLIARELGSKIFAQALACACIILAPVFAITAGFLSTLPFDQLCWALCGLWVVRLLRTGNPRWWLAIGATVGIGLETKHNMAFLAVALALGVLLSRSRADLLTLWPYVGLLLALGLAAPHLIWQVQHGFPTWEFTRNAASDKNAHGSPLDFLLNQITSVNPPLLPVWSAGLVYYFGWREGRRYVLLGLMYVIPALIFMATGSIKADYLAPAYTFVFPAGALLFERITEQSRRWLRYVVAFVACSGIVLTPFMYPVLPAATLADVVGSLSGSGVKDPSFEQGKSAQLPQYFADQFGWQAMTEQVAAVYNGLTPQEKAQAVIFTGNYGEAGALTLLGKRYRLPPVISGHNNYYLWGSGNASEANGAVVIVVSYQKQSDLQQYFASVEQAGKVRCQYCMDYENNRPIFVARGLKQPLREVWPLLKNYS